MFASARVILLTSSEGSKHSGQLDSGTDAVSCRLAKAAPVRIWSPDKGDNVVFEPLARVTCRQVARWEALATATTTATTTTTK